MTDGSSTTGDDDASTLEPSEQRATVRERYGRIATDASSHRGGDPDADATSCREPDADAAGCCSTDESAGDADSCVDDTDSCIDDANSCADDADSCVDDATERSREVGYADAELDAVAEGANLGLGCGNPTAIASLEPGDDVLDLGSGGGFDCFLAAQEVGENGSVVGVDMTPEMVERARENVAANDASNVAFRLGEIEHLPVADASVDVVISNCVVNLSPDKPRVFEEAYRVLRPGGRLAISDVVATADLPDDVRGDPDSVAGCVGGASSIDALEAMLRDAGFESVSISPKADSDEFLREWDDDLDLGEYLVAARIEGEKPTTESE